MNRSVFNGAKPKIEVANEGHPLKIKMEKQLEDFKDWVVMRQKKGDWNDGNWWWTLRNEFPHVHAVLDRQYERFHPHYNRYYPYVYSKYIQLYGRPKDENPRPRWALPWNYVPFTVKLEHFFDQR